MATAMHSFGSSTSPLLHLEDPSEYRPEYKDQLPEAPQFAKKNPSKFRNFYGDSENLALVKQTYLDMHTNQTLEFVNKRMSYWKQFNHAEMTVMGALELLENLVDQSDPDVDVPNIEHAFQTAERIREAHPDKDWFHLTGLIHDLGKVMALWGEKQFAVVGDTYPLGCAFSDNIVFRADTFHDNADLDNPKYNTKFGMYSPHCGLDKVTMSWSHDEYMYQVMKYNNCTLPAEAFYMIRFHSFYPWHTCGDYQHLCNEKDKEMLLWIREFNRFDLYSKSDSRPNLNVLKPYYQSLIDKYLPGKIKW